MVQASSRPTRCSSSRPRADAVVARARASARDAERDALVDALVRGVEAPLVLDADALYALAGRLETLRERPGPTALTPHAGELARLLGRDSDGDRGRRLARVGEAAERSGAAVLLKGPDTLVAAPGEPLRVVETAVPAARDRRCGRRARRGGRRAAAPAASPPAQALALAAAGARLGRAPGALAASGR